MGRPLRAQTGNRGRVQLVVLAQHRLWQAEERRKAVMALLVQRENACRGLVADVRQLRQHDGVQGRFLVHGQSPC